MTKLIGLWRYGEGDSYTLVHRMTGETYGNGVHLGGWIWTVQDEDGRETDYRTDKDGYGLWVNGRQTTGTCQYRAPRTRSGMRRSIIKNLAN
jgi:hypothetical protein